MLTWGLREEVPSSVSACWGARWIFPNDMLNDRQDFFGMSTADGQKLKDWLVGKTGALNKAKIQAEKAGLSPKSESTVVLYEDETGVVKGNPRSSYGYLYVCAYLKESCAVPVIDQGV